MHHPLWSTASLSRTSPFYFTSPHHSTTKISALFSINFTFNFNVNHVKRVGRLAYMTVGIGYYTDANIFIFLCTLNSLVSVCKQNLDELMILPVTFMIFILMLYFLFVRAWGIHRNKPDQDLFRFKENFVKTKCSFGNLRKPRVRI